MEVGYSRDELERISAIEVIQVYFAHEYAHKGEGDSWQWSNSDREQLDRARQKLRSVSRPEWLTDDFILNDGTGSNT